MVATFLLFKELIIKFAFRLAIRDGNTYFYNDIFQAGIYLNLFIFKLMTGRMVAAGFLVAGAGYIFGAFLAWIFR